MKTITILFFAIVWTGQVFCQHSNTLHFNRCEIHRGSDRFVAYERGAVVFFTKFLFNAKEKLLNVVQFDLYSAFIDSVEANSSNVTPIVLDRQSFLSDLANNDITYMRMWDLYKDTALRGNPKYPNPESVEKGK